MTLTIPPEEHQARVLLARDILDQVIAEDQAEGRSVSSLALVRILVLSLALE